MNSSQFQQRAPVGSTAYFPESGTTLNLADGSTWLHSGYAASAATYPAGASLRHMQIWGAATVANTGAGGSTTGIATDGAGTWVICNGNATNVYVSTNSGLSWAAVAHNLGMGGYRVAYGGGIWVVVGNSGAAWAISSATTPSGTWTLRSSQAVTATANTASVAYKNSRFVGGVTGATTNGAFYSTNGTAYSFTNLSVSLNGSAASIDYGNGQWGISGSTATSNNVNYSGDNGLTWSTASAPTQVNGGLVYVGSLWVAQQNGTFLYSTAATLNGTWTSRYNPPFNDLLGATYTQGSLANTPGIISNAANTQAFMTFNQGAGAVASKFATTSDGLNWEIRQVPLSVGSAVNNRLAAFAQGTNLVVVGGASFSTYSTTWGGASDFVGLVDLAYSANPAAGTAPFYPAPQVMYVRIA